MIHAVVGIIQNAQKQFLIAKRPAHKTAAGLWEFPGGKIESGETPLAALVREFREEVDLIILKAHPFCEVSSMTVNDQLIQLHVWWITEFQGIAKGAEGQEISWVKSSALSQYQFPAANNTIIEKILTNCSAK